MKDTKEMVEIWGDVVSLKSLVMAVFISGISTMTAYFLAPLGDRTQQLFFGLAGAFVGFMISTFLIAPKRTIILEDSRENSDNRTKETR